MNRVKHVVTSSALYSLYCTLVMPYLTYWCEVWGNNYKTRIQSLFIYTTKIDGVVCPPNIPETVAGRLMKLAHRPRIASTIIKLISKPILLAILLILVKTIQRIVADPKRFSQSEFSSTTADVARTTFRLDRF